MIRVFGLGLSLFEDDRARGSSAPFTPEELAAIAAFPRDRVQRIAQGEFSDVSRAEMMGCFGAVNRRRRREAEVGA